MASPRPQEHGSPLELASIPAHLDGGAQLRAILNGLPAVIAYWDSDLRNVMANDAFAELFGWEAG